MNRNLLLGVVAIIIVAGIGFYLLNRSPQATDQTPTTTNDDISSPEEKTIVLSEQNGSGESGTATLVEENGKVKVTLTLTGAPEGVTQPAHIHVGSCPDVAEVKYPLASPVNGMSETVLDVNMDQLRSELPLGINVHKSTDEASIYVSCGDLAL